MPSLHHDSTDMKRNPFKSWLGLFSLAAVGLLITGTLFSLNIGRQLVQAVPRTLGDPPEGFEAVQFGSDSGSTIHGWLAETPNSAGAVLLLHGIRADRRSMVDRARFLAEAGYHALCIDFQAHGESSGEMITMGYLESKDAAAGVAYLRNRFPDLPIAVVGSSMGAAAALLANYDDLPPEVFILEGIYTDITTATRNRLELRFGRAGGWLTPVLIKPSTWILGVDLEALSPLEVISEIHQPVLILHGSEDRHARPVEARAVFQATRGEKEIWEVPNAAHIDLHRHATKEYEKRVADFLERHLTGGPSSAEIKVPPIHNQEHE